MYPNRASPWRRGRGASPARRHNELLRAAFLRGGTNTYYTPTGVITRRRSSPLPPRSRAEEKDPYQMMSIDQMLSELYRNITVYAELQRPDPIPNLTLRFEPNTLVELMRIEVPDRRNFPQDRIYIRQLLNYVEHETTRLHRALQQRERSRRPRRERSRETRRRRRRLPRYIR
jgi:hypothetical protein